jgi:hypothetical protein
VHIASPVPVRTSPSSVSSSLPARRRAARRRSDAVDHDPIAATALRPVERGVGGVQYIVGTRAAGGGSGGADAHRERDALGPARGGRRPLRLLAGPLGRSDREHARIDRGAQLLERRADSVGCPAGEQQRELLAAVPKGAAAVGALRQLVGHHAQRLVPGVVSEAVVESLEAVDIDHRDNVVPVEPFHAFIEGAAARQAGQLVVVGEAVRVLDHRGEKCQLSRRQQQRALLETAIAEHGGCRRHHHPQQRHLEGGPPGGEDEGGEHPGHQKGEERRLG